jgi:hypothetical protein
MLLQANHFVNHFPAGLADSVVGTLRASPPNRQVGKTKQRPHEFAAGALRRAASGHS